jgi:hypothetical protein
VCGEKAMAYKGSRVGVEQMFNELVAAGRERTVAALELGMALQDGAIVLGLPGGRRADDANVAIAQWLRDFAREGLRPPPRWLSGRWRSVLENADADRQQFERACGLGVELSQELLKESIPANRRFVEDERLVDEALKGIRSNLWANPRQAALALADQAKGASPEAIVDRLRRKIKAAGS